MSKPPLEILSDVATEAHARIQSNFAQINPVVSVTRKMRTIGIPADAMTIDCLASGKRILIVLRDEKPGELSYQFGFKDKDPAAEFESLQLDALSVEVIYDWMVEYFT